MSVLVERLKAKRPRVAGLSRREWLAAIGAAGVAGAAEAQLLVPRHLDLGPRPPQYGYLHTTRLFSGPYAAAGSSGYTYLLQTGSEVAWDYVRLVYANTSGSPYTIGEATFSASREAPANGYSAYSTDGTTRSFTPATFNNGGSALGLPWSMPGGSTGSIVVPAGTVALPSIVFSDWVAHAAIAPTDGGTFHYLLTRTYISAGTLAGIVATPIAKLSTDFPTIAAGRKLKSHYSVGTPSQVPNSLTGNQGYVVPVAVQFYSRRRGITIATIGDSLAAGRSTTSDHNCAVFQAVKALSTPSFPLFCQNEGYSGQTSPDFYARGKAVIDAFAPDVAVFPIFSPNDGTPSQASCDASFDRAVAFASYCRGRGTIPILTTALPLGSTTSTTDAYLQAINARLLDLRSSILVADAGGAVSDGANPRRFQVAYDSGDATHPNDAGQGAIATQTLIPILTRLIM